MPLFAGRNSTALAGATNCPGLTQYHMQGYKISMEQVFYRINPGE